MSTYISLLRGINVSGQKRILMADLQRLYASLGLTRVRTYVQSGNVVFDSGETDSALLEGQIAQQIKSVLGFDVPVLIRSAGELQRILNANPYLNQHPEASGKLYVLFLAAAPDPLAAARLIRPAGESGEWIFGEKELFLFMPDGVGNSKLTNSFFESKLKTATTMRNWNTVNALLKMALE